MAKSAKLVGIEGDCLMRAFRNLAIGLVLLSGCTNAARASDSGGPLHESVVPRTIPVEVSMYQLIATPERYNGKVVQVIGVGHFEEGFGVENEWAVFATRDDEENSTCGRVYIRDLAPSMQDAESKLGALMGRYVIVSGTFEAAGPVPPGVMVMDQCPDVGALRAVTRVEHWAFGD